MIKKLIEAAKHPEDWTFDDADAHHKSGVCVRMFIGWTGLYVRPHPQAWDDSQRVRPFIINRLRLYYLLKGGFRARFAKVLAETEVEIETRLTQ